MLAFTGCTSKKKANDNSSSSDPKFLAIEYLSQNRLDEAEAAFRQAIKNDPQDISNYIDLTRMYLLQKEYDEAEKLVESGLKIKPDNTNLKLLLAEIYNLKNENNKAINELKEVVKIDSKNVLAYYKLAELDTSGTNQKINKDYLLKVQNLVPANIVPRLQLATLYANEGKRDSSLFYLQSVKKIAPDFSDAANKSFEKAIFFLEANQPANALPFLNQFEDLMKTTNAYAAGISDITIPNMIAGFFDLDTNVPMPSSFDSTKLSGANRNDFSHPPLSFTVISEISGASNQKISNAQNGVLAVTDYDAVGNMYVYSGYREPGATSSKSYLAFSKVGIFNQCKVSGGIDHKGYDLDATFADYDNDGYQDLFIATTNGILIYKNNGDGTFSRITDNTGLNNVTNATKILFADFDQDGDLDMYVATTGKNLFFRNNGDGTFTENAAAMNLTGDGKGIINMDFGDWDNDGDLDIFTMETNGSIHLLNNNRRAKFTDISETVGLENPAYTGTAFAIEDYNNDGTLDILIAGGQDGKCFLLKNEEGKFTPDMKASEQLSTALKGIKVNDVAFTDYDNDGLKDIVIAGENNNAGKTGVKIFHDDGAKGFSDASNLVPDGILQATRIAIADFNFDGDRDIFLTGVAGALLMRNDGGNNNNYVQIQLTGLSFGNSKNNRLGIGAQIEIKAGDLYQLKTAKGPITEFGVGSRTKIDALRIIWPNGVPQLIEDPTRKQKALEEAQLKGSCPFLFTWDGKQFVFLKDMLWRSALGMPVAIHGKDTTYAYKEPSKEYLLIPGDKLKPRNGLYTLKITEELWEAVYFDKTALVAVDHPDSVDAYVDERFVAPPYPGQKIYLVSRPQLPVSAVDDKGNDVLPRLSKYDYQYVSNFSLGKFQGVAKEHDLILDLGNKAENNNLKLYMQGWIFPPDASINTELTQTSKWKIQPPSLQVINKEGKWQTVIEDIGYPMGRDKMVIVDLTNKFLTPHDRRVRIRTNMQIYWDYIFFSVGKVKAPVKTFDLKMVNAQLNFRGYSASYSKGGPYGPNWLDYYKVTKGQKWRDLTGNYTRYGDVLPLLQNADDQYIICNGGDEVTIDFDTKNLPALPKGWKRDFIIYSEGWVKDGDLNTAHGQTVGPLPFHNMPSYPYGNNIEYPADKSHREYQQEYNTRKVTTEQFRNAIKDGGFANAKD